MSNRFFLFFLFLVLLSFSQEKDNGITVNEPINIDSFPTIEFDFNHRNPKKINNSALKLFEINNDGSKDTISDFTFDVILDTIDYSNENKCVLILLESLAHSDKKEQNATFEKALEELFDEGIVSSGDKFKICTFSLMNNETTLVSLNDNFTDDIDEIKNNFNPIPTNNNQSANIYSALTEGIDMLTELDTDLPKFIYLLSDEYHDSGPGKASRNETQTIIIEKAREQKVVINAIKYSRVKYGEHRLPELAKQTFGERKQLDPSNGLELLNEVKKDQIKLFIKNTLSNAIKRSKGVNYNLIAELNNTLKDGKKYKLELHINSSAEKIKYKAPGNWLVAQFQQNTLVATIVSVLIFILFVLFLVLIRNQSKKRKRRRLEQERKIFEQQRSLKNEQARIRKEQEEKNTKEEAERRRIESEEQEKKNKELELRLINEMKALGSLPILTFIYKNKSKDFPVNKPVVKVGRDNVSNHICVPNQSFSRKHFMIKFSNGQYKIIDQKSLNGTKLNGVKIKESIIKQGDVIEVGDVKFYFS